MFTKSHIIHCSQFNQIIAQHVFWERSRSFLLEPAGSIKFIPLGNTQQESFLQLSIYDQNEKGNGEPLVFKEIYPKS